MTLLILDIGTSSARALLYDAQGEMLPDALVSVAHAPDTQPQGASTFDPQILRQNIEQCIDKILLHPQAKNIQAVGMATFVGNVLGLQAGEPITPVYTYADVRSSDDIDLLKAIFDASTIWQETGCALHTAYLPSRLAWLRRTQRDIFERVDQWVDVANYLYSAWFGADDVPMSYSTASWSGLLNRETLQWYEPILAYLQLTPEQFPKLSDYDTPLHGLAPKYADRWEQLADVPFFLAVGDGAAANVGSGCVDQQHIALTLGTTAALRVISPERLPNVPNGLWGYRVTRDLHLIGGATTEGGNIFAWLRENLHIDDWDQLEKELLTRPSDSHGLTFLPLLAGERSPGWRSDATGSLLGMRLSTSAVDIVQAALEGVSIRLSLIAAQLASMLSADAVIFGGGGALLRSNAWAQMIADAFNRPLHVLDEGEITAKGVALLVNHALYGGVLVATLPAVSRAINPRPDHVESLQVARERQLRLYDLLYNA